jgi:purine-binding chemotaxis protein CheW
MIVPATELRSAFDRSFAEAPAAAVREADILAIHAGGMPYALAQTELAALRTDLQIVALPSPSRALLGVAAVQGAIVAVWDLGILVHGAPVRARRWCAIVRGAAAVVAFDQLDGYLRLAAPVGVTVSHGKLAYRVLDLTALVAAQHGGS